MYNCWLSPEGDVISCINHDCEAWEIIKERYGLSPSQVKEPSIFLGERNWMLIMPVFGLLDGGNIYTQKHLPKLKWIKSMS